MAEADKKGAIIYPSRRFRRDPVLLLIYYDAVTSPLSWACIQVENIYSDACHAPSTSQLQLKAKGFFRAPPRAIIAWYLTSLGDGWAVIDSSPTGFAVFFPSLFWNTSPHQYPQFLSHARCFSFQFQLIICLRQCKRGKQARATISSQLATHSLAIAPSTGDVLRLLFWEGFRGPTSFRKNFQTTSEMLEVLQRWCITSCVLKKILILFGKSLKLLGSK